MTCVKTGSLTYFENYGMAVRGDTYQIGDCYIIRWVQGSQHFVPEEEISGITHMVVEVQDPNVIWHRDDLGISVVPREYVRLFVD